MKIRLKVPRKPCTCNDELYAELLLQFSDKVFAEALMNSLRRLVPWGAAKKRSARGSSLVKKTSSLSPAPTRPEGCGVEKTEHGRKRRREVEVKLTSPEKPLTPSKINKKRKLDKEVERISAKLPDLTQREESCLESVEKLRTQDPVKSGDLKPNPKYIKLKVGAARPTKCQVPVPECDNRLWRHPERNFCTVNSSALYCDPYLLPDQAHQYDALAATAATMSPSGLLPDLNIPVPAMEDGALVFPPPTASATSDHTCWLQRLSMLARQEAAEKTRLKSAENRKARMEKMRQRRQILLR